VADCSLSQPKFGGDLMLRKVKGLAQFSGHCRSKGRKNTADSDLIRKELGKRGRRVDLLRPLDTQIYPLVVSLASLKNLSGSPVEAQ